MEGAWRGPFPLNGTTECELRLKSDRSATIQCDRGALVAAGHYDWDGSQLTIAFTAYTRGGEKATPPEPLAFKVKGAGNSVRAAYEGQVYEWNRHLK